MGYPKNFYRKTQAGSSAIITPFLVAAVFAAFFFTRGFYSSKATIAFIAEGSRFVQVDEAFNVSVIVESKQAFNTVGAIVRFPADLLEVTGVSKDGSILEVWVDEPAIDNADGVVVFSGGIIRGYQGTAKIATIRFQPKSLGEAIIDFEDATVLAHDGRGTEILGKQRDIAFFVRPDDSLSPDIDDDNRVTISDLSKLLAHYGSDTSVYDLNGDGSIGAGDVSVMLSRLFR
ncbi:MAG: hypothetical protein Q8Q39_01010 [bacterium]|nr:hypothetical protein [bacterium]